jgi:hypothetical protein
MHTRLTTLMFVLAAAAGCAGPPSTGATDGRVVIEVGRFG